MSQYIAAGGALDKLKTGNYDPQFEKFWRSSSWRAHLKNLVMMVYCCIEGRLKSLEKRVDDLENP